MTWEEFVERLEEYNDTESSIDEATILELQDIHTNPFDFNAVTRDDLLKLPFLTENQVNDIILYVEKNAPILSFGELMLIPSLNQDEREMLRLFLTIKDTSAAKYSNSRTPSWDALASNIKNELVWRTDIPLYTTAGYGNYPDSVLAASPNKVYQGDPLHHSMRYSLQSLNRLFAGIQMEKDAGERGIDHVSAHIFVKDLGFIKSAAIGDYRLSFGQGLAVNTGMRFGKMMTSTTDRLDIGISKHSSLTEAGFFRGAATTIRVKDWELSAFLSYRKTDGTMRSDSLGISTLKTDGLHRTISERNRKGNLSTTNFGGNIHWGKNGFTISATAIATHFSIPLTPIKDTEASLYRKYNATGQDFLVTSVAYGYKTSRISFTGETACSSTESQNGFATINTLRWQTNRNNTLSLVGRSYGAQFVSINGRAFSENTSVQNEQGALISWTNTSLKKVKLLAYADIMYFPWLKYQVGAPSHAYEALAQAQVSPGNKWKLLLRYRMKTKQKDFTNKDTNTTTLRYNTSHNLKFQLSHTPSPQLTLNTTATAVLTSFAEDSNCGFSISEAIHWKSLSTPLRIGGSLTLFSTDNFNSRISCYEPSLLYSFGFTSLYHHGIRTSLLASIPIISNRLSLNARISSTILTDGNTLGTALDATNSNHKEDLQLQVVYKW